MSGKNLTDRELACKPVQPSQAAGSERAPGPLARFAKLARRGPVLMSTAQFGRSPVREAAYRLRERRPDLDLKLSWRLSAASRLGSARAVSSLETLVCSLTDPDDRRFDVEDEYGLHIRAAINELPREGRLLPMTVGESFARASRANVTYAWY